MTAQYPAWGCCNTLAGLVYASVDSKVSGDLRSLCGAVSLGVVRGWCHVFETSLRGKSFEVIWFELRSVIRDKFDWYSLSREVCSEFLDEKRWSCWLRQETGVVVAGDEMLFSIEGEEVCTYDFPWSCWLLGRQHWFTLLSTAVLCAYCTWLNVRFQCLIHSSPVYGVSGPAKTGVKTLMRSFMQAVSNLLTTHCRDYDVISLNCIRGHGHELVHLWCASRDAVMQVAHSCSGWCC